MQDLTLIHDLRCNHVALAAGRSAGNQVTIYSRAIAEIEALTKQLADLELKQKERECANWRDDDSPKAEKTFGVHREIEQQLAASEQERDEYKRLYDLRGKVLQRPCLKCGYAPQVIKLQGGE